MAFFTAEHLTYVYPNGLRALDDVAQHVGQLAYLRHLIEAQRSA